MGVDEALQGIAEVVRGADLLDSTPRQIYLQSLLGMPAPAYVHLPVAAAAGGRKLSKQNGAPAIDLRRPGRALHQALAFLGQPPPAGLCDASVAEILSWARDNWSLAGGPPHRRHHSRPDSPVMPSSPPRDALGVSLRT